MAPRRRRYPQVERLARADAAALAHSFVHENRPVVVPSGALAWCADWSPSSLVTRYGASPIDVEETATVYVGERAHATRPLEVLIAAALAGDTSLRWKGLEFLSKVPAMRRELLATLPPHDALLPEGASELRRTMWIAPRGTMSSLHHDGDYDNLNLQVSGRKLFLLVPPPRHRCVYSYGSAESPVNPFVPDLNRFPRFAEAGAIEATLDPGDVLLIPKYWWHCVYTVEPSVNLSTHFYAPVQPSAWSVLEGAPLVNRMLACAAASLKRRGYRRFADVTRTLWWEGYSWLVPRASPQERCALADP